MIGKTTKVTVWRRVSVLRLKNEEKALQSQVSASLLLLHSSKLCLALLGSTLSYLCPLFHDPKKGILFSRFNPDRAPSSEHGGAGGVPKHCTHPSGQPDSLDLENELRRKRRGNSGARTLLEAGHGDG